MGAVKVRHTAVRSVVELVAENGSGIVRRLRIDDTARTGAAAGPRAVIYRSAERVRDEKLQAVREPPGEASLQRMIRGLRQGLVLGEPGDIDTLEWRTQRGILRRVDCNHRSGDVVDDWIVRGGEACLVNGYLTEEIDASGTNIRGLEQQIFDHL